MDEIPKPKVGVGVIIIKEGKVLMGKRKGSPGEYGRKIKTQRN